MDSKTSCINYLELQPVMIEMIGDAEKQMETLKEFVQWLEDHGADCIDDIGKFCKY